MTGVSQARRGHTLQISRNFAEIVLRSAKEASGKAATSSRRKHEELRLQLTASGLGTGVRLASSRTRGLASSATEKSACSRKPLPGSPRPEAPRNFPAAGTLLLASVEPAGPVPSGAHSVASERLIRRALGREAANARIMSKKNKIQGWEKCKQHLGGPLRLQGSLAHFQRAAPAQKFTGSSNQLQTMNSRLRITIHIFNSQAQTLSDHTLFSDRPLSTVCSRLERRTSSVREVYLYRNQRAKRNKNLQKRERTKSCKPEKFDRRIANDTDQLLQI